LGPGAGIGGMMQRIRLLVQSDLGLSIDQQKAPMMGRSNEGKLGTRKVRFGRSSKFKGRGW
jgi:excinuclease ABC subunit B